jgi:hypothetical protein
LSLFKGLLRSVLIAAALVPFSLGLPFAAVWLCRTPDGAMFLFWAGPWSCCVLTLFYSQWSSIRVWQKAGKLRQWRGDHGGFIRTNVLATAWMFGSLFASYAAELLMVWKADPSWRPWLPAATYSPVFACWLWRRTGHA